MSVLFTQLLEEGEDGKDRATLKAKLELPVQVLSLFSLLFPGFGL